MAKTNWIDGTHLTPAQMILFFGNNAGSGHDHDGTDNDGHCPKVSLTSAAHVTGLLPIANIATIATGTVSAKITTSFLTVQQTATFTYLKINNFVFLYMPTMTGTSNSTDLEISPDTTWPSDILPPNAKTASMVLYDNGNPRIGQIIIPSVAGNNMVCYNSDSSGDMAASNFTNSGLKGYAGDIVIVYSINT